MERPIAINLESVIDLRGIRKANQNRFEHGLLARLKQFQGAPIRVLLSDVVVGELTAHVTKEAAEAQASIRAGLKLVGKSWQVDREKRDKAMEAIFGTESPKQLAERRLQAFVEGASVEKVASSGRVDVDRLLTDYFGASPPFDASAAKKSEFPDALALQALERWAIDNGTLLLVVSGDKGWLAYCKRSEHLVAVSDLANALSFFHERLAEAACARLAARYSEGRLLEAEKQIESAVEEAVERIWFIPEASSSYIYDADVDHTQVASVELVTYPGNGNPFRVVDKPGDDVLVVEAEAVATIEVGSTFTLCVTDPIDKDQVPIGSASRTRTVDLDMTILLTFEGDLSKDAELVDVEVEMSHERVRIDYGEVGPDWSDDEGEEEADPADDDAAN